MPGNHADRKAEDGIRLGNRNHIDLVRLETMSVTRIYVDMFPVTKVRNAFAQTLRFVFFASLPYKSCLTPMKWGAEIPDNDDVSMDCNNKDVSKDWNIELEI
jgi:hypothetical protein